MALEFIAPGRIVAQVGATEVLSDYLSALLGKSVLIVTDEGIMNAGLLDAAKRSLIQSGQAVAIFDKVTADPSEQIISDAEIFAQGF